MNESFVFKNKKGATCGYIMARGRQLRIRLPEGMEKACLTAVYEDGERNFEGGFDGYETERPNDGGRLIGAYVTSDGKMVLDTGTAARKAFENRKSERFRFLSAYREMRCLYPPDCACSARFLLRRYKARSACRLHGRSA